MKYLFIGGRSDGRWIDTPDIDNAVRIPYLVEGGGVSNDLYRPRVLAGGDGGKFTVFCLDGISGTDALAWLLQGYRRGKSVADGAAEGTQ